MTIKKILIYLAVCLQCCRTVACVRHMRTTNIWIESMLLAIYSNLWFANRCKVKSSNCYFLSSTFFSLFGFYEFTVAREKVKEKSACRIVAGLFQLVSLAIQKEKQHKKRNQFAFTPDTMCWGRQAVPFAHFFLFHVQKSFRSNFFINQNVPQRRAYDTVVCLASTECADPSVFGAAIRSLRSPVDATT